MANVLGVAGVLDRSLASPRHASVLWNEAVQKLQATKKPPFLHLLHLPAAGGRRLRWVDLPWDVAALAARGPGGRFISARAIKCG